MSQQVEWGTKPSTRKPATADLDKIVHGGAGKDDTVRFNADIPRALHRRVKSQCALEGLNMTAVVIELLEQRFPKR